MLPVVLRAVIAGLLTSSATGLVAPRSGATQPLGANRLPFRRAHDDAAAAALDSFDDLASLERRLAALDDGVVPKLRGFFDTCLLYTSPSPRDATLSRMPSSA